MQNLLCHVIVAIIFAWTSLAAPARACAGGDDGGPPYQGRRVVEVLVQLQKTGLQIVFSSSLVPATLVVKTEPHGRTPRQIVLEILAGHGLALKQGPGKTWLVIKAPVVKSPPRPTSTAPAREETAVAIIDPQQPRIEEQVDVKERITEFAGQPSVKSMPVAAVRETAGGLENVLQVLPLLPGVAATDDEQGKIAVRGGGPEHNVILFDGVQVHSPQRFGDFTSSFINPAVAANVALDASGLDARYGGRLSSVLVIETRDGRTDRRFALSGSAGLTNGDITVEGRLPGTTSGSWWAAVRGTYYTFVSDRFRGGGKTPSFADAQFKFTFHPTTHTRLSLVGLVGREGMVKPLLPGPDPIDPIFIVGDIQQEFDANNRLSAANLWWTPNRRLTTITTVTGYSNASRFQDHWTGLGSNTNDPVDRPKGPFDRRVRVDDVGLRQRAVLSWSARHALDAGMEVHRVRTSWFMTGATWGPAGSTVAPDTWGNLIAYSGPIDVRTARTQVGAWAQESVPLGAGLAMEPGVRVDWNSFTHEQAVQPRLRVTRRFGEMAVWAGLAWQAQTPGHETMQQGSQFVDLTGPEASALRDERSRQIVFGIERPLTRGLTVRAEVYRRTLDRLLVQRLETDAERQRRLAPYDLPPDLPSDSVVLEYRPTVHPESTGTGRAAGFEVLVRRDRGWLTGWVAYTLSKAERDLYGRTVPFDFDRRHALAAALQLRLSENLRASVTTQFATGFPMTPVRREVEFFQYRNRDRTLDPIYRPQGFANRTFDTSPVGYPFRLSLQNSERLQPYARTDVRVTYALGDHWELYGEVINLFDRTNFVRNDPAVGYYELYDSYPILPTYGVRVKF